MAKEYLRELQEGLYMHNSSHIMLFYSRYILLSAAVNCYLGNLKQSIEILHQALVQDEEMFTDQDKIKLQLNLSIYYFMAGEYEMSLKTGTSFEQSEKWLEKNIGREWIFKKQLMEVIIQVELGNDDIATNRIRSIERASSGMFNHPLYSRAKTFLDLIKKYINDPIHFKNEEIQTKIEKHLTIVPEEREDLQAMTFYAWLKSKYLKQDYYQVLLETVKVT